MIGVLRCSFVLKWADFYIITDRQVIMHIANMMAVLLKKAIFEVGLQTYSTSYIQRRINLYFQIFFFYAFLPTFSESATKLIYFGLFSHKFLSSVCLSLDDNKVKN